MAKVSTKRNHYGASFFCGMLVGAILYVLVCVGLVMGFVSGVEDFKFEMLFDDGVWDVVYEEVSDRFTNLFAWEDKVANYEDEPTETVEFISFEGVKLSEVAKLEMLKYIDFTIPYNWAFGKVDVENPSTEEAIAITADNVVLTMKWRPIRKVFFGQKKRLFLNSRMNILIISLRSLICLKMKSQSCRALMMPIVQSCISQLFL